MCFRTQTRLLVENFNVLLRQMDEVCAYCSGYLNTERSKSKPKSSAFGVSAINQQHGIFIPKGT